MNQKIYQFGKNLKKKISHFKFDMYHKYHAKEELKVIELVKGKTEPKLIKLSKDALTNKTPIRLDIPVRNVNRTVGTMLGSQITMKTRAT